MIGIDQSIHEIAPLHKNKQYINNTRVDEEVTKEQMLLNL